MNPNDEETGVDPVGEAGPRAVSTEGFDIATSDTESAGVQAATYNDHGAWVEVGEQGGQVVSLGIDGELHLVTAAGMMVSFGEGASVVSPDGQERVSPDSDQVGPFVDLLWHPVRVVAIAATGQLEIDIGDDRTLTCPARPEAEGWTIQTTDGSVICLELDNVVTVRPPGATVGYRLFKTGIGGRLTR